MKLITHTPYSRVGFIVFLWVVLGFALFFGKIAPTDAQTQCCKNIPAACGGGQQCITCNANETCQSLPDVCYYHTAASVDDGRAMQDPNCVPNGSSLTCNPASQSNYTNTAIGFTATGGSGTYTWSAPSGVPATGSGASFSTSYTAAGSYTITVNDGATNAKCAATISPPPPPPPPPLISASFNPSVSQYSVTTYGSIGANTPTSFYTRNIGSAASQITWKCKFHTGYTPPPGLTVDLSQCVGAGSPTPLTGGAPPFP